MKLQAQLAQNSDSIIRAKILDIYGEYKELPTRIQNDLSFNDYWDFYLGQRNMTDMAKRKYLSWSRISLQTNSTQGCTKKFRQTRIIIWMILK